MKPEVQNDDGYRYYAAYWCLLYVNDVLIVHHDGVQALKEIDHIIKTKPGLIRDPEFIWAQNSDCILHCQTEYNPGQ